MKKIHSTPPTQRYELGVPFEKIIHKMRNGRTDTSVVREAVAEKWIRERGPLPKDCEDMLKED